MNSKMNGDLRSGKAAVKTVKGFTLVEMLVVIAILGILAGMISLVIVGFVRDANIETNNDKAQQAYTTLQNVLIEAEIMGKSDYLNQEYINTGTADTVDDIISIEYYMDSGILDDASVILTRSSVELKYSDLLTDASKKERAEKALKFIKRNVEETSAADFTGYVYADIDIENFLVESIVFTATKEACPRIVKGTGAYADMFKKPTTGTKIKKVYGCKNIFVQKADYKMKGEYIGYYPFMDDVGYTLTDDKTPKNCT